MAEPFKNLIGPAVVRAAATHLQRAWRGFDAPRFESLALGGLEALELKARAMHLCAALEATLPRDFRRAAEVMEASLAPAVSGDNMAQLQASDAGLAGWVLWPMGEYVARHGQQHPTRALATLHAFTQRFTAEWAVRPFIVNHPELCFATLQQWTQDPSAHVRRLVSEGSRPRLPWGLQLKRLIADPRPTLPLLLALQDDPSEYVRRSVANHLNDIAKDHPALVADWLEAHLPDAPNERRALLRHASRSLIKAGDRRVLNAWGIGAAFKGEVVLQVAPQHIALGDSVELGVTLHSSSRRAQTLHVDYLVHHVKGSGGTSHKVFKGRTLELAAGATLRWRKRHAVRPVTTRRYWSGPHRVELQINGRVVACGSFELRVPATP